MFHILPNEMMVRLTQYLNLTDLFSFSQVNKHTSAISHYAINHNRLSRFRVEVNFFKKNLDKIQAIESVRYRASLLSLLIYVEQQLDNFQRSNNKGLLQSASMTIDMINNKLINTQLRQQEGTYITLMCISRLPPKAILRHQEKFKKIKRLELKDNCLENLPSNISICQELESLNLYENPITRLPDGVGTLPLKHLYLSGGLLPVLPQCIYQLKHIEWVSLENMGVSSLSPEIKNLRNLTWLYLGQNCLEKLPIELISLRYLAEIFLEHNKLSVCQPYGIWGYLKHKKINITNLLCNQNTAPLLLPANKVVNGKNASRPYLPLLKYSQDIIESTQPDEDESMNALSRGMEALNLNTFHA